VLGLLKQATALPPRAVICVLHNAEHIQRFADLALSLNPNEPSGFRIRRIRPASQEVHT